MNGRSAKPHEQRAVTGESARRHSRVTLFLGIIVLESCFGLGRLWGSHSLSARRRTGQSSAARVIAWRRQQGKQGDLPLGTPWRQLGLVDATAVPASAAGNQLIAIRLATLAETRKGTATVILVVGDADG